MSALLLLIVRRALRNAPLTLAVLAGLLVLVTLPAAAPLYTTALEDLGLRATLAEAPVDQRGVRAIYPTPNLQPTEYTRLSQAINQAAAQAAWLDPAILAAVHTRTLLLPGGFSRGEVALAEADTALEHLHVIEGRLPEALPSGEALEVVLGSKAADALALQVGDRVELSTGSGIAPVLTVQVVGLVEPAELSDIFWQSDVLDLEPVVNATRREAVLLLAPEMMWTQVVPRLPAGRAAGEYRWRIMFDVTQIGSNTVFRAGDDIGRVVQAAQQGLATANAGSDFNRIVADYRSRLALARAPLLLLFIEITGLSLIYITWTAAFQAEATASEQAVLHARGAGIRQIVAVSGGLAALLAAIAGLLAIPLAVLLLRFSARLGPFAILAGAQEFRPVPTAQTWLFAFAAALTGILVLVLPAIPAARRSITALRQGDARPARTAWMQRSYLDLLVIVLAGIAFVQLERQGSLFQQIRGRFAIDPLLVVAPFLMLIAGALLFLRLYPWLLQLTHMILARFRGFPAVLALMQLTRDRGASSRLVLLLSITTALGLFTQTFGANLALNQRQRAGYMVGADGRVTLGDTRPLLPGALPPNTHGVSALRESVNVTGASSRPATLLAFDPADFPTVMFNPADHPVVPMPALLAALGPAQAPDGLALPGRPRDISLELGLGEATFRPAAILNDVVGGFHVVNLDAQPSNGPMQTFSAAIDLPEAAFPLRLFALGLLSTTSPNSRRNTITQPPIHVSLGTLAIDGTVIESWRDSAIRWDATADATVDARDPAVGTVLLDGPDLQIVRGRQMRGVLLRPNPQELAPVPVAVDPRFLQANSLEVGDTTSLALRNRTVPVRIAGVLDYFPTLGIDDEPFMIAQGPALLRRMNTTVAPSLAPNEVWLDLPDDPAAVQQLRRTPGINSILLQATVFRSFSHDPLAVGIAGVFFIGFLSSVGLTALGFATALYLAGRRRSSEFAILQAIGLDRAGVLVTLAIEQIVLVTLALLAGTGLGALLGRLILPLMAISDQGRSVVPPYLVVVPWRTLALTYGTLIAIFAGITVVILWLLLRRGISGALRLGEG